MPTCCVPLCTNSGRIDGMKLYQFPKDEDRRQIWTLNVRRHGWKPTNTSKICQAHFDRSEFKLKGSKLRLLKDAVPTLFRHSVPKPKRRKPPHPRGRKDEMSNADKEYIRQHDHNYAAQASSQLQTSEPTTKPSPVQEQDPSQDLMNVPDPMAVLGPTEMAMPSESSSEIVETCIENGPGLGIHEVETGALRLRIKLLEEELAREKMAHSRLKRRMLRIVKKKTSSNERKKSNKKLKMKEELTTKFLEPDQWRFLQNGTNRGSGWSSETIKKALKLRHACGMAGYQILLDQGYPLPCLRTLRPSSKKVKDLVDDNVNI